MIEYEESPSEYLKRIGVKTSKVGHNEVRFKCPACDDDEGFSFNTSSGLWVCMRASCGERGNLFRLKVLRGDAYEASSAIPRHEPIDEPPPLKMAFSGGHGEPGSVIDGWVKALESEPSAAAARSYLESRGFCVGSGVAKRARLGWVESLPGENAQERPRPVTRRPSRPGRQQAEQSPQSEPGWITIPYPSLDGSFDDAGMVKLRAVPPERTDKKGKPIRYRRIAGGTTTLYAPLGVDWRKPMLLCGGELDALSTLEALGEGGDLSGLEFSVVSPSSESSWGALADVVDKLHDDVVVVFDSDDAGVAAADRAAASIGRWRCRIGHWPDGVKDANEALVAGKLDYFSVVGVVQNARSTVSQGIAPSTVFEDRVIARIRRQGAEGWSTPWHSLDKLLGGGLVPGDTTVVTGHTGAGKSLVASQVALEFVARSQRVWFAPFELGVDGQLERCVWQLRGRDPREMVDYDIRQAIRELDRILWFDHYGAIETDAFAETLTYVVRRLDVDLIVLDHRDFMLRRGDRERWNKADELAMAIVKGVQDSTAHCLLVVHPSKPSSAKKDRDDWIPQLGDAKGHSDIYQDVSNYMAVYRPRSTDRSERPGPDGCYDSAIVVEKVRNPRGGEGTVQLRFDKVAQRYYDAVGRGIDEVSRR